MPNNKQKKMRGKIASPSSSTHRAVVPFDESSPTYFITFKTPAQRKIRIKIPKLLSKPMQKGFHGYNKNNVVSSTESNNADDREPRGSKFGRLLALSKVGSMFNNVMKKAGFGLVRDQGFESLEEEGPGNGVGFVANETGSRSVVVIGRREKKGKFITVSKRALQKQGKPRMARSLRKIGSKRFDLKCLDLKHTHVAEEKGLELCKKRILMGGKCKALSVSGVLHYDKNGVLVPEELP